MVMMKESSMQNSSVISVFTNVHKHKFTNKFLKIEQAGERIQHMVNLFYLNFSVRNGNDKFQYEYMESLFM